MDVTPAAREHLAEIGYDADFGARPLKRNIQKLVQDPLALKLLSGDIHEGSAVTLALAPGGSALEFRTDTAERAAAKAR